MTDGEARELVAELEAEHRAKVAELERELDAERQRRFDGNRIASEEKREELAAAQARGRQLHLRLDAVLEFMDPRNHQTHCECDPSVGYQCAACSWPTLPEIAPAYALLAMRTNEDALREMIEAARTEEREAVFTAIEQTWYAQGLDVRGASISDFVTAIRERKG